MTRGPFDPPGHAPVICFACSGRFSPLMTKRFPYDALEEVEYLRCDGCGLVVSKTHYELSPRRHRALNESYFGEIYRASENPIDPRWRSRLDAQSRFLKDLFRVVGAGDVMDFGAGDGYLVSQLKAESRSVAEYDLLTSGPLPFDGQKTCEYPRYLLATSVLEHLFGLALFKRLKPLTRDARFFFCYHTLVCEDVPDDPSWFYLTPLHVTFFTNRAMEILLRKTGFSGCVYAPEARMWVSTGASTETLEAELADLISPHGLVFRDAFVDFWKVKPVRAAS